MNTLTPRPLAAAVTLSLCLFGLPGAIRSARADDVHFDSTEPRLELWNRTSNVAMVPVRVGRYGTEERRAFVYAPLCQATPCTANLALGPHSLALSLPGEPIVESGSTVNIDGPSDVTAVYHDRSTLRGVGLLVALAGPAAGLGLVLASPQTGANGEATVNPALLGLGIGVGLGGLVAGLAMLFTHDSATFTLTPLVTLGGPPRREMGGASGGMNGLALGVRF